MMTDERVRQRYEDELPGAEREESRFGLVQWWHDLSLLPRLLISFLLVVILLIAQSVFVYRAVQQQDLANDSLQQTNDTILTADRALQAVIDMQTGMRGYFLTGRDEFLVPYTNGRTTFTTTITMLKQAAADDPAQLQRLKTIEDQYTVWIQTYADQGIALRRDVNSGQSTLTEMTQYVSSGKGNQQVETLRTQFADLIGSQQHQLQVRLAETAAQQQSIYAVMTWGPVITILLGALIVFLTMRNITRSVAAMAVAANAIADGRQDQRVVHRSRDELGQLAAAFRRMIRYQNGMALAADAIAHGDLRTTVTPISQQDALGMAFTSMVDNLRGILRGLQVDTQHLSQMGMEISATATEQVTGATEQSAAIAETTATVDEVRASAEHTLTLAQRVTDMATQTNLVADEGVVAINDATTVMADIRERTQSIAENILILSEHGQQIGDIITTVSDLADQSNLLALNAAIEASRAGEHGKGFAVVAQEIRTLAEGSKAATTQVRTLLSDVQRATNAAVMATEQGTKGVDSGVQTIERAGKTITELVAVIREAAGAATQISASVRQHAVGMEQIASAMNDINNATAQSLRSVSNSQQAVEHLNDLANRLHSLTSQYQM